MPDTPATGRAALYFKTDGKLYKKLSTGVESEIGFGNPAPEIILLNDSDLDTWGPTTNGAETILKSVVIPANTLDLDSTLFVKALASHIGVAPNATWRIRVGGVAGTIIASFVQSTSGSVELMVMLEAILSGKDATNAQRGIYWNKYPSAIAVAALSTSINWANEQTLVLTAQVGGGTNVTMNSYYMYVGYVP